ncbi:MAG: LCP family protein [Anaerolineae bacterium]
MTSSQRRRARPQTRQSVWTLGIIAFTILLLVAASSIWLYQTVSETAAQWEFSGPNFGDVPQTAVPNPSITVGESPGGAPGSPAEVIAPESVERWSGNERVSILLLGIDQRCDEEGPTHTDSMMVLTVDPVGLSAAALSLPRDLWVKIPGFEPNRINQAYYLGQVYEYPGGGPALAMETVETTLGVTLDYYVSINFDAFIEVVDLIGGIEVNVPENISDPTYPDRCYGYDPFYITAGTHALDGETALKYARTRATFGGDVDRAGRQQAVILAVRDRIMDPNRFPKLIAQAPGLWQAFQDNVSTNMPLNDALRLAVLLQDIPRSSIQTAVINYEYVYNETTPDGRQVLVPDREKIRELRDKLFRPSAVPTPVIENLPLLAAREDARVAIFNGTAVFGLAAATQEYLQGFDINVVEIGNADSAAYRTTHIIQYGNNFENTSRYLTQLMNVPPLNITVGHDPEGEYDVLVIIGNDWRVPDQ